MVALDRPSLLLRSVLTLSLSVAGCGFLGKLLGTDKTASQSQVNARESAERDEQLTRQDEALQAEVQAQWTEIDTEGITAARALALGSLTRKAYQSGAVERGHVNGEALTRSTIDHLGAALEAEPDAAPDLHLAAGDMHRLLDQSDEAAGAYSASLAAQLRMDPFVALLQLPRSGTVSQAVLDACPTVRSLVSEPEVPDFVDACLSAAGGDGSALQWDGIKGDLVAHEREMARRAEEQRRLEEEERKRAEEEAAAAAIAAAKQAQYQVAAVFAAGSCSFGDCMQKGWEIRTDDGTIRVTCSFSDCLKNGWEARFPDGGTAKTSCNFGDCMQKGWETRFPDGESARTSCNFGECATKGWETRLPDGGTARTSCNFGECYTKGWETRLPDGGSVRCSCNFGDCLQKGTECR